MSQRERKWAGRGLCALLTLLALAWLITAAGTPALACPAGPDFTFNGSLTAVRGDVVTFDVDTVGDPPMPLAGPLPENGDHVDVTFDGGDAALLRERRYYTVPVHGWPNSHSKVKKTRSLRPPELRSGGGFYCP